MTKLTNATATDRKGRMIKPPLRYVGAKWRVASWITDKLPAHRVYVEPFFGSGAILCSKPRARNEIVNDIDGNVVNLFRVMRDSAYDLARLVDMTPYSRDEWAACIEPTDNPLEAARRFVVRSWMSRGAPLKDSGFRHTYTGNHGLETTWAGVPDRLRAVSERLRGVYIENRDAVDLIRECARPNTLIYADPPYVTETRTAELYAYEMGANDHARLLDALCEHPGPVALSGYDSPLYADRLAGWRRYEKAERNARNGARVEVLWLKGEV